MHKNLFLCDFGLYFIAGAILKHHLNLCNKEFCAAFFQAVREQVTLIFKCLCVLYFSVIISFFRPLFSLGNYVSHVELIVHIFVHHCFENVLRAWFLSFWILFWVKSHAFLPFLNFLLNNIISSDIKMHYAMSYFRQLHWIEL